MSLNLVLILLVGYCIIRELVFLVSTHKLINKLMSRNYHEYTISESRGKMGNQETTRQPGFRDDPEDLGILESIN